MALSASATVACVFQAILAIIPVLAVGIETDHPAPSAVALEADVAVGMAGLAGGQRATGFPGVADRPGMEIGGD